ncbi:MAG TPA: carboxyl transferase domain-containing protein [Acidimicrobiales bacterium]|nr:carboxyl transferase domain-containing protein [Acidimicrobiales bacterium]
MAVDLDEEWDEDLRSADPLRTPGYAERLAALPHESVRTGRTATHVVVEGCFDALGGSMGVVHGERVVRAFDRARELGLPVVCHTRSGGARMQEGMVSLLQMGRVASAVRRHGEAGLLSVAVLRSPTTGGVLASYASLCDVRVAEAGAVVGFAGPRVVAHTTGEEVEGRSHTAETALAAGLVDAVRPPDQLDRWVDVALGLRPAPLAPRSLPVGGGPVPTAGGDPGVGGPPAAPSVAAPSGAWAEVVAARRLDRPTGVDVAAHLCASWLELGGADRTVRTALARIGPTDVVVVASDRHAGTGRPGVAGFRQARRAMALAGRLGRPLVTLVDTPGAEPGPASENAGIAGEIAATFAALDGVQVPTVGVCVGEGGSGGALALAWTDVLLVQEHAVFSVIGPEGAALILERDATRAPAVAEHLGLTSGQLLGLGVVDAVVPDDLAATSAAVGEALSAAVVGRRRSRPDAVSAAALGRPG